MRKTLMMIMLATALPAGNPAFAQQVDTQETGSVERGPSGLPLPRFVSLKSSKVNLRIGPGKDYAVSWLYLKSGLPVEIIQEYDNWRRIRDAEGTEGWVYQSLLSGKRTAVVAPWLADREEALPLHKSASDNAAVTAMLQPGVIVDINGCDGEWCSVSAGSARGHINQMNLWGAYPGETVED